MLDVGGTMMMTVWVIESIDVEAVNLLEDITRLAQQLPQLGGCAGSSREATSTTNDGNRLATVAGHGVVFSKPKSHLVVTMLFQWLMFFPGSRSRSEASLPKVLAVEQPFKAELAITVPFPYTKPNCGRTM